MTKLEILKSMLSDPKIMEGYDITEEMIEGITLSPYHANDMVALIQHTINITDSANYTANVAAANLNIFLENRLRDK